MINYRTGRRSQGSGGRETGGSSWRFLRARKAVTALESVCCLVFIAGMLGSVFEVVNTLFVGDMLDRAAYAVARDNSLHDRAAATEDELLARAWTAIRAEVGDRLDPEVVQVDIDVYDDPSKMLADELSQGANAGLGGDGGDMVVVRLRYQPSTPLGQLRQSLLDDPSFLALAVVRNERIVTTP